MLSRGNMRWSLSRLIASRVRWTTRVRAHTRAHGGEHASDTAPLLSKTRYFYTRLGHVSFSLFFSLSGLWQFHMSKFPHVFPRFRAHGRSVSHVPENGAALSLNLIRVITASAGDKISLHAVAFCFSFFFFFYSRHAAEPSRICKRLTYTSLSNLCSMLRRKWSIFTVA